MLAASAAIAQIVPAPPDGGNSYSGTLVNAPAGVAVSQSYVMDLSKYDASKVSAQVLYSTVSFSASTFTDGSESTGSVTVVSYTALSSSSATDQITIANNSFTTGVSLTIGNNVLTMGQQFNKGPTSGATATNLAAAIALLPNLTAKATGSVVYTTATYGSYANTWNVTSNNSSMTVTNARLSGGTDNACLTINGTPLCQGVKWTAATSNGITARNISAAINTAFSGVLVSTDNLLGSVVASTSVLNGTAYNYSLVSSTPTAMSVIGFTGGTNPGDTLGSSQITAKAATGFVVALPVLYSGTPAIGGLTTGTTYYAVPVSATQFSLAKYSTSAATGYVSDYAVVTSTSSQQVADTYTLTPSPWVNNSTFTWQSSNDNTNWFTASYTGNVSTGPVVITSATSATDLPVDFGVFNYRYLRLNLAAPSAGAVNLVVPVNIKQDGIGRF